MSIQIRTLSAIALLATLAGCGEGLTTQEAYATCEEFLGALPADATEEESTVFADCVACHEDCGRSCAMSSDALPAYECPEE